MCHSGGLFVELTDRDKTDLPNGVTCLALDDIEHAGRVAYYAAKIARLFV